MGGTVLPITLGLAALLASCSFNANQKKVEVTLQEMSPREIDGLIKKHEGEVVVAEYWFFA
jgi:hypothetical protein